MKKTVKTYGDGGGTKGSAKSSMLSNKVSRLGKLEKAMAQDTGKGDMDQMSRYNTVVKKLNKATGKLSKSVPAPPVKKASNSKTSFKMGGTSSAFAKLAPPYNKATFADKIAGAKKKK
jgi:hypothetical protein